MKICEVEAL